MRSIKGHFFVIVGHAVVAIEVRNLCSESPTFQMEVGIKRSLATTFSAVANSGGDGEKR